MRLINKAVTIKLFFRPPFYALLVNPYFIARRGLFLALKKFARADFSRQSILDVGCGDKPYRGLFKTASYTGIDIVGGGHADQAKQADKYYDGENIPFDDQTFNLVICTQVLEHSVNPEKLLVEINRVLKIDGQLYLSVPFVWDEHEKPFDFRRYTSFGLTNLLTSAGFRDINISRTSGVFGTTSQIISVFLFETLGINIILKLVMAVFFCFPLQFFGLALDFIFRKKGLSLDYIVIAKK